MVVLLFMSLALLMLVTPSSWWRSIVLTVLLLNVVEVVAELIGLLLTLL